MSVEMLETDLLRFSPGPFDAHMHPRVTDGITEDAFIETNEGVEGKAGLEAYTVAALRSGFTGGGVMPNEIMRLYAPWLAEKTMTIPYPISNIDRVHHMQSAIQQYSRIPLAVYQGIDPAEIFDDYPDGFNYFNLDVVNQRFDECSDEVMALKLWGDPSTGGYNIPREYIPVIAETWHRKNPEKPVILHLEDEGVAEVLEDMERLGLGHIPIHIAHVSSKQELQAVIDAKQAGMNVTCEVTVHHLFLTAEDRIALGGYGCMKPSLKSKEDIDFLWANMRYIDMFASDCAPHRKNEKEADKPAFGVTNHTVMLPLLLGAVEEGKITMEELNQKLCIAPRERFNIPLGDGSETVVRLDRVDAELVEAIVNPGYGHNPFVRLKINAPMVGRVIMAKAGKSDTSKKIRPSYSHIIKPYKYLE